MQHWDLLATSAPEGTRDPVVLLSKDGVARAVLIALEPGQSLGDHQVKEHAWVTVVDGSVLASASGSEQELGVGGFVHFDPDERHAITSEGGARILLLLAPWPGVGHYRGDAAS
jgi:quercetin dioxygenase-like cupin family protein